MRHLAIPTIYTALVLSLALKSNLPTPAHGATFTVTKIEDTNDGSCNADCSLREAVIASNAAAGADEISITVPIVILTRTGSGDNTGATGDLDLSDDVLVTGLGPMKTSIAGGQADRVFDVHAGATVTLEGLRIRDGIAPSGESGGGVRNQGSLTLREVVVAGNGTRTGQIGGGVANLAGADLVVESSSFLGNTAGASGGAIANVDGATVEVRDSSFVANIARGQLTGAQRSDGGAISTVDGTVTIERSTFRSNQSGSDGGAVFSVNSATTVKNSTFTENFVDSDGGALGANNGGTVEIANCTFDRNSSSDDNGNISSGNPGQVQVIMRNSIVANGSPENCSAGNPIVSQGYNLDDDGTCNLNGTGDISSVSAELAPITDNGGPTETVALCSGSGEPSESCSSASPALDAGNSAVSGSGGAACETTDQRGIVRPQGSACDIGAFEQSVPSCGDGTIDAGEACDDGNGNGTDNSCCASDCQFKDNGAQSCDGNPCTRPDVCTDGVCSPGGCADGAACTVCGGTCADAGGCQCLF